MLKLLIFLIGVVGVLGLKCHICDNFDSALCFTIENTQGKFLEKCKNNETRCALLVEKSTDPHIVRSCVTSNWLCDLSRFNCKTCTSDGCNVGTEVEKEIQLPDVDLLMSNIQGIFIILLLIAITIIWCLMQKCSKKEEFEYEEDDCDEYYVNETNIDLE